jgi:hypothetical protein
VHLGEYGVQVEASVDGGKRRQPTLGFLELSLEPDAVPAPCLVPRDRHVDEALEEVLLGGLGRSPGVLERLVRREVLAPLDQLETALVFRLRP